MLQLSIVLIILAIIPFSHSSFCDTTGIWKQVYQEEFNSLDQNSWTITLGQDSGQGRDAYLTAENVFIQDGKLVLRSQKQIINNFNYTSGAVTSRNKKYWKYGRVCVSAILPGGGTKGQGQGIWPAHWMMPNDQSCWPDHGEIDIMEMINGDSVLHGTYHWNDKFPGQSCIYTGAQFGSSTPDNLDWSASYHEYATEWGPGYITFLLDSKPYVNITEASSKPPPIFPPSPMYLILNTAVGGPWPGPPAADTKFPTYHFIDYVRVSQKPLYTT